MSFKETSKKYNNFKEIIKDFGPVKSWTDNIAETIWNTLHSPEEDLTLREKEKLIEEINNLKNITAFQAETVRLIAKIKDDQKIEIDSLKNTLADKENAINILNNTSQNLIKSKEDTLNSLIKENEKLTKMLKLFKKYVDKTASDENYELLCKALDIISDT